MLPRLAVPAHGRRAVPLDRAAAIHGGATTNLKHLAVFPHGVEIASFGRKPVEPSSLLDVFLNTACPDLE